ncbi:hypothetical protein ACFFWD_03625 [Bradyrhizobium erythrophlei]|uniref:hypothetical protein n=1 Tax=Bradyrhizobium erythrophlei TaxID=1437360 RepID=UPI0035EB8FB4
MARLPQYPVERSTAFQRFDVDDHPSAITPTIPQADNTEIEGAHANHGKEPTFVWSDTQARDLPVDATIEAEEVDDIDAISRINSTETRAQIKEIDPGSALAWLDGPNLARSLLSFVTPRLRHPDVLRAEKHGILLEHLADVLSAAPDDSVSREGIPIVQQQLRRLILLRQNQNSLIKG